VEVLTCPVAKRGGVMDLKPAFKHMAKAHSMTNILVEGGGVTVGTLLQQGLIDELMVFVGPTLLGDGDHTPPIQLPGSAGQVDQMAGAHRLWLRSVRQVDGDVLIRYGVREKIRSK
jgi:diaminohydroxyphosphoribosylaminopyrimidine deaminase/5-amino-6-(5-phosphoribosylamino)uracil reductase